MRRRRLVMILTTFTRSSRVTPKTRGLGCHRKPFAITGLSSEGWKVLHRRRSLNRKRDLVNGSLPQSSLRPETNRYSRIWLRLASAASPRHEKRTLPANGAPFPIWIDTASSKRRFRNGKPVNIHETSLRPAPFSRLYPVRGSVASSSNTRTQSSNA